MGPRARNRTSLNGPMPNAVLRALVPTMLATLLAVLAACVPAGTGGDAPTPAPAAEISVTSLPPASEVVAAPAAAEEGAVGQTPEAPTPADAPAEGAAEVSAEAAPPPPSPQALACQRRGGAYRAIRPGGPRTCLMQTGEGTKRCTRQTDCKGQCLARSGTCSPITPLFGCNEILQADGRRATLCIE